MFSAGLVLAQLALMDEVTGFNAKTLEVNGEKLIRENLKVLEQRYSASFSQLFSILLCFEESNRPSFCEIESLFLEKELDCKQHNKPCNQYITFYNQRYNNLTKGMVHESNANTNTLKSTRPMPIPEEEKREKEEEDQMETRPKQNYYKDSTLMLHESCYWFEFGGSSIGRFSINRQKWKIDTGSEGKKFPLHFSVIFIPIKNAYFLLGGSAGENFRIFQSNKKLVYSRQQMPSFRNFFPSVYHSQRVYVFGGYDGEHKMQMKTA